MSLMVALALCISLVIPAGGITSYASTDGAVNEAEVTEEIAATAEAEVAEETAALAEAEGAEETAAPAEAEGTEETAAAVGTEVAEESAEPVETVISGYETVYNKRLNQVLEIEADITPAGGREVQLQRYNSTDGTWTMIETISEDGAAEAVTEKGAAVAVTEDGAVEEVTEDGAAEAVTEDGAAKAVTEDGAAEAVAEDGAAEAVAEDGAAEAVAEDGAVEAATEDGAAEAVTEDGAVEAVTNVSVDGDVVHVCFDVPAEERSRTSSQWRLYVPASEKATEAYSEIISVTTRNLEKYGLSARNACVYRIDGDGSGTMIYSKESKTEVAQASTTKLMTAILLLESGLLDTTTVISRRAANTPWGSGRLKAGDIYNTKDLLYAMLLPSSNDAATAVAEKVGGTEAAFVQRMNAKAEQLGYTQTHFCNPHGLDAAGHYTTALELAKLTAYAYTFPEIRDCWGTQWKTIRSLKYRRKWTLWSTNAIFGYISSFLGGKTGTEDNAGCCFTGVYEYEGAVYVTVVLGSGYGFARWRDTKKLHSYIREYATSRY